MHTTEIRPAVAAAIFNNKGEILLQKRADVNQWGLISGHVEFGETVQEAILREIVEETNTRATITRFIGVYSAPSSQTYYYSSKTVQYITHYFQAMLLKEIDHSFSNEETRELNFFDVTALPAALAQMDQHWLSDALDQTSTTFMR